MIWPGMRFSLRSQCKRCSSGRLHNSLPHGSYSSHSCSTRRSQRIEDRMLPARHGFVPRISTSSCSASHHFYFTSPQPIKPKEASDGDFTIEDVMLGPVCASPCALSVSAALQGTYTRATCTPGWEPLL